MLLSIPARTRHGIPNFVELRRRAQPLGPKRVAIVAADYDVALTAADGAQHLGIAIPVLIGNERRIRLKAEALGFSDLIVAAKFVSADSPATVAISMVRDGQVDILLKGHLRTDELLREHRRRLLYRHCAPGFLAPRRGLQFDRLSRRR